MRQRSVWTLALGAGLIVGCFGAAEEEQVGQRSAALCNSSASCNGKDPYVTKCVFDGTPVASYALPDGKLELFWSKKCQSNWAQVTRDGKYYNTVWVQSADGTGTHETLDALVSKVVWSNLWYAPNTPMRACVEYTECTGDCDTGETVCTDFK